MGLILRSTRKYFSAKWLQKLFSTGCKIVPINAPPGSIKLVKHKYPPGLVILNETIKSCNTNLFTFEILNRPMTYVFIFVAIRTAQINSRSKLKLHSVWFYNKRCDFFSTQTFSIRCLNFQKQQRFFPFFLKIAQNFSYKIQKLDSLLMCYSIFYSFSLNWCY